MVDHKLLQEFRLTVLALAATDGAYDTISN